MLENLNFQKLKPETGFMALLGMAVLGIFITLLPAGCTYYLHPQVSSMNFSPEAMQMIGHVCGHREAHSLLCLFGLDDGSGDYLAATAQDDAVGEVGGDAMINTLIDETKTVAIPFKCTISVKVCGTVVRFKPSARAPMPGVPEDAKPPDSNEEVMRRVMENLRKKNK